MYYNILLFVVLIVLCIIITLYFPLPGTSRFSYGHIQEGMTTKQMNDYSYPHTFATHLSTDFAIKNQLEVARVNAALSRKIEQQGIQSLRNLRKKTT